MSKVHLEVKYHVYVILAVVVLLSWTKSVQAAAVDYPGGSYVPFEHVSLVQGSEVFTERVNIERDGEYELKITDFDFPDPFEKLGVAITTSTEMIDKLTLSGGELTASSAVFLGQGNYYLTLFGIAGVADLGLYGVQLKFIAPSVSAVPLPAGIYLLLSGIVYLFTFRKHREIS